MFALEPLEGEGGLLRDVGRFVSSLDGLEGYLEVELLTVLRRMPNFSGSVSGVAGSLFRGLLVVELETVVRVLNHN